MRTRKDERDALVELLEQEFESADKLADALLKRAYELIQQRETYVVGVTVDDGLTLPVGPHFDEREAVRAAKTLGGPIAGVVKIYPTAVAQERVAASKNQIDRAKCGTCRHPLDIHMGTGKNPGCPAKNCECKEKG